MMSLKIQTASNVEKIGNNLWDSFTKKLMEIRQWVIGLKAVAKNNY
jgi:hypothetical protein